ncbi:MAG: hypothetical protein DDT38_00808 [Firmicutes bacterium]|nr:hypothetical protein [candidate division NPL-UPA2 bacterium]
MRSVWSRVGCFSHTLVTPVALSPAKSKADFTWALAMGKRWSHPLSFPPATISGGRPLSVIACICPPISVSGPTILCIGRLDNEASPTSVARIALPAKSPAKSRMVVPEFSQLSAASGSCQCGRPFPSTQVVLASSSIAMPTWRRHCLVAFTSSESERPQRHERPGACAATSSARWLIDLSPGTLIFSRKALIFSISMAIVLTP